MFLTSGSITFLAGLVLSMAVDPYENWVALGTSLGYHVIWDMRFQLPIRHWQHTGHQKRMYLMMQSRLRMMLWIVYVHLPCANPFTPISHSCSFHVFATNTIIAGCDHFPQLMFMLFTSWVLIPLTHLPSSRPLRGTMRSQFGIWRQRHDVICCGPVQLLLLEKWQTKYDLYHSCGMVGTLTCFVLYVKEPWSAHKWCAN